MNELGTNYVALYRPVGAGGAMAAHITDGNILDNSYYFVKHFSDFPLWEYKIATYNQNIFLKSSKSVLPKREIREIFY